AGRKEADRLEPRDRRRPTRHPRHRQSPVPRVDLTPAIRRRRSRRREVRMEMSPIPKTAPFADEEIDLLNRVVGTATPVQRAWLAGFLAGLDTSGGTPAVHPAAPARPAEPLTIVYARDSGNSEKRAGDIAKSARKNALKPTVVDMADLDLAALTSAKK